MLLTKGAAATGKNLERSGQEYWRSGVDFNSLY